MEDFKITKSKIKSIKSSTLKDFPLYTTYLINKISETAQATRENVVGQLSEEFPLFIKECNENKYDVSLDKWKSYHKQKYPNAITDAKDKIKVMLENFKNAINKIDDDLIERWVEDLVYEKTFIGMNVEQIISEYLISKGHKIRKATPQEESQNIDIYIDGNPYQIKPEGYDRTVIKSRIQVPVLIYSKDNNENIIVKVKR